MGAEKNVPDQNATDDETPMEIYRRVSREMDLLAAELETGDVAPDQK